MKTHPPGRFLALVAVSSFVTVAARAQAPVPPGAFDDVGRTVAGEPIDPRLCAPGVVESMEDAVARDLAGGNQSAVFIPLAPRRTLGGPASTGTGAGAQSLLGTSPPQLSTNFVGPREGDVGANSIPPDSHGAVGINHFVAVVNTNVSVYVKSTGVRVVNTSLGAFFGSGAGGAGDPRAIFDPASQRFIILCSDFQSRIFLAVSSTSDPTGSWFKTNFIVSTGVDAGRFPDYPTLGVDANGIYTASFMVGGTGSMSIFALNKAPLVGSPQSLGTVTAFRSLPYEDAIQPVVTWGSAPGEYLLSTRTSTTLRLRRVNPPLTAPTLSELGNFAVSSYGNPPNVVAPGGALLDSIDVRLMNAVFRDGRIWTAHAINSGGRAAARWYELNPTGMVTVQQGTVNDPVLGYVMPTICPDGSGNVVLAFSGASSTTFASAYYTGRSANTAAGVMAPVSVLKAGEGNYTNNGTGVSRWGDYSNTSCDPVDDSLWTIQEYARGGNTWGNWIGRFAAPCQGAPDCNANGVLDACDIANGTSQDYNGDTVPDECQGLNAGPFCVGDGSDPFLTVICPCFNLGDTGHGCGNSVEPGGGLLQLGGLTNPDTAYFVVSGLPPTTSLIFVKGSANNGTGAVFGDGIRCVSGAQVRFGSQFAQSGMGFYPDLLTPPISIVGNTPPGSGTTAWYQCFYRNPASFCTTATFNMTNGVRIVW